MNIQYKNEKKSCSSFRCGFIAIIGRPSVGKSTFINFACGHNTTITSPYPQTTRNIIRGIVNHQSYQMVLLDTPGLHSSNTTFGLQLTQHAHNALKEAESILYMLDASRLPQEEEKEIINILQTQRSPIFAAVNKMDIENPHVVHAHIALLKEQLGGALTSCHFISAQHGINIPELLQDMAHTLPEQPAFYPEEYYTDQTPEFRICEQVRAAALEYVQEELPYALYTEVIESTIKHKDTHNTPTHIFIRVQLVVERPSQQGILIGKHGSMIKKIRLNATKRIKTLFPYNVQLELRVTVKKKWRKDKNILLQ